MPMEALTKFLSINLIWSFHKWAGTVLNYMLKSIKTRHRVKRFLACFPLIIFEFTSQEGVKNSLEVVWIYNK